MVEVEVVIARLVLFPCWASRMILDYPKCAQLHAVLFVSYRLAIDLALPQKKFWECVLLADIFFLSLSTDDHAQLAQSCPKRGASIWADLGLKFSSNATTSQIATSESPEALLNQTGLREDCCVVTELQSLAHVWLKDLLFSVVQNMRSGSEGRHLLRAGDGSEYQRTDPCCT